MRVVGLYAEDESYGSAFGEVGWARDFGVRVGVQLKEDGLEVGDEVFCGRGGRHGDVVEKLIAVSSNCVAWFMAW